jgi:hypothetical protein
LRKKNISLHKNVKPRSIPKKTNQSIFKELTSLKKKGHTPQEISRRYYGFKKQGDLTKLGFNYKEATKVMKFRAPVKVMISLGFTLKELKQAKYTAKELSDAGVSPKQLKTLGYSPKSLMVAGIGLKKIVSLDYSLFDLISSGIGAPTLVPLGYSLVDIKKTTQKIREINKKKYTRN